MDPPVPMPNTEVKHLSADDSTMCKNRTLPASFYNNNASLAQSVEQLTFNQWVGRSSRLGDTI